MSEEIEDNKHSTKVRVASYSNMTWQGGWRQRARAWWGTGLAGILAGAAIGGVMILVQAAFGGGFAPLVEIIESITVIAAAGGTIGLIMADSIGAAAGATSAGFAEWESRFKQMMLEAGVFDKSMVEKLPITATKNQTEVVDNEEEVNFRARWVDEVVNWPGLATFATLGASFGGLIGYFDLMPEGMMTAMDGFGEAIVGAGEAKAASAITGATLFSGMASLFGINFPILSNKLNNFFSKIFSKEIFESKSPELEYEQSMTNPVLSTNLTRQVENKPVLESEILVAKDDSPKTQISHSEIVSLDKLQQINEALSNNQNTIH